MSQSLILENEQATLTFASQFAPFLKGGHILFLKGDLGAGKTTFVRGILRGFGFLESVKSPTYALVEEYEFAWGKLIHFDLYRIRNPEELHYIGIRDYFKNDALILIEWPELGGKQLPNCDLEIHFLTHPKGRQLQFKANTQNGENLLQCIQNLK